MSKKLQEITFTVLLVLSLSFAAAAEYHVVINIPAFKLWLYQNGIPIKSYPISIGTELNPSVVGETRIINKVANPTYYPPNAAARGLTPIPPGPDNPVGTRWLGLGFAGYGIHGTNNENSIGSAASSGCIRMYNADVEELSEMVEVGTVVKIMYQTVIMEEDPLLGTKIVTIFPDVYKQGSSLAQLQAELERLGWEGVHWPALLGLLQEADGQPQLLPLELPVSLNGNELDLVAVKAGEQCYLPVPAPHLVPADFQDEVVQWGEQHFLPLQAYLDLTGLRHEQMADGLRLIGPYAYLGRSYLGKALVYQGQIYVAGTGHACQLVPQQMTALTFWGNVYFPAEHFLTDQALTDLRLEWEKED